MSYHNSNLTPDQIATNNKIIRFMAIGAALAFFLVVLAFLLWTPRLPRRLKAGFLVAVIAWTGVAVANNLDAIYFLGLSPLGAGLSSSHKPGPSQSRQGL